MTTVLHVSDPHFGTEMPPVRDALLRLAQQQRPDLVVLSGDITQRARRGQFAAAREFYDRVPGTHKISIPGNHDIPLFNLFDRVFRPYGNYRAAFGGELEPSIDAGEVVVITVNTTRPHRHKNGAVGRAQVERVTAKLRACLASALRIVVTHQPVSVITAKDEVNRLRGYRYAVEQWATAGADLVLGGHIHLPYVRRINDEVPGLAKPLWAVQAGTAVSSRIRGGIPNSVNLIRYDAAAAMNGRNCVIERWDYAGQAREFSLVESVKAALDA